MLHVAPDLSGVIPLNAFEAQAAGVRNLAAGAMDLAGTAGAALKEMQEVRDAGQWAQARDGLYRFEQDVMRELEAGLPLPAGQAVSLAPGGNHIMLMGVTEPLKTRFSLPAT